MKASNASCKIADQEELLPKKKCEQENYFLVIFIIFFYLIRNTSFTSQLSFMSFIGLQLGISTWDNSKMSTVC